MNFLMQNFPELSELIVNNAEVKSYQNTCYLHIQNTQLHVMHVWRKTVIEIFDFVLW